MATIYGANTLSTGYDVANSLRFDNASSDYLNRTQGGAGNRKTWTFSTWIKISKRSGDRGIFSYYDDNNNFGKIGLQGDYNQLVVNSRTSGTYNSLLQTNYMLRDFSSWYNIIVAADTTQGTEANRIKIYINGVQITSFSSSTYPSQNHDLEFNITDANYISNWNGSSQELDGYLAETVFIDGSQLDQTSFGEFDSDSPTIWKPIDVSDLTFGTYGFYLDYEDSSSLGNDVAGSNNFSVNNLTAVDQSTDTCTNNFATKNANFQTSTAFTKGALVSTHSSNSWQWSPASLAFQNGKWYAEVKVLSHNYTGIGLTDLDDAYGYAPSDTHPGKTAVTPAGRGFFWYYDDGKIYYNDTSTAGPGSFTTNDILMFAIDMTNSKYHFGKNGSWLSSSDPANNSGGYTHQSGGTWTFFDAVGNGGSLSWNYGSPDHSVSSGNSDANGYGNFEYSVPSGYYTLNSKNLAEFG